MNKNSLKPSKHKVTKSTEKTHKPLVSNRGKATIAQLISIQYVVRRNLQQRTRQFSRIRLSPDSHHVFALKGTDTGL